MADAPLKATGVTIHVAPGQPFLGTVATITDANPDAKISDYTATIDWGDGGSSAGAIAADSTTKSFDVTGTHIYTKKGRYTISVKIQDSGGSNASAISRAIVTASPSSALAPAGATTSVAFMGAIAASTGADPGGLPSEDTAAITRRDGSSPSGAVAPNGTGGGGLALDSTEVLIPLDGAVLPLWGTPPQTGSTGPARYRILRLIDAALESLADSDRPRAES